MLTLVETVHLGQKLREERQEKEGDRPEWVIVTMGGKQDFLLEVAGGHRRV